MVNLVPVTFEDGITIYVESVESATILGGVAIKEASATDIGVKALEIAQQLSNSIKSFCGRIIGSLRELEEPARPTKATIEFGLNISAEGNVYIIKGTGQASIKITAEWQFNGDNSR
jgi:hypothetical protein